MIFTSLKWKYCLTPSLYCLTPSFLLVEATMGPGTLAPKVTLGSLFCLALLDPAICGPRAHLRVVLSSTNASPLSKLPHSCCTQTPTSAFQALQVWASTNLAPLDSLPHVHLSHTTDDILPAMFVGPQLILSGLWSHCHPALHLDVTIPPSHHPQGRGHPTWMLSWPTSLLYSSPFL